MNKKPSLQVSVVIPAYNIEAYIGRAIESVLAQTRGADEIIVVDDGSTDNTTAEIKKFGDKVRHMRQENGGAGAARNRGIRAARFEWIGFLDGDDEWHKLYLQSQIELLERNPDLMWSCANTLCCLCGEDRCGPALKPEKARRLVGNKDYFDNYFFSQRCRAGTNINTMMIRREVFDKVGFFPEGQVVSEDTDMWWRIAYQWPRIGYVPEPLAVYHQMSKGSKTNASKAQVLQIHIELLEKHLRLARENNQQFEFEKLAGQLVANWIRSLLFDNNPRGINELLQRFGYLVRPSFRALVRVLSVWPGGTAASCHLISKIVRKLHLRRRIVPPPQ